MEFDFQWRPFRHWAVIVHFAERVGWHNSIFIQVLGFCFWAYWNKKRKEL